MKKALALLLAAVLTALLPGCGGPAGAATPAPAREAAESAETAETAVPGAPAGESTPAPEKSFADAAEAQAFAAAMACHLGGVEEYPQSGDTVTAWDMTGWYAAWLYRTAEVDLVEESTILDALESFGAERTLPLPEGWEEYGVVRVLRGTDGSRSYDFAQHKREIDAMLGVDTECAVTFGEDGQADALVTVHYENGLADSWGYGLTFAASGEPGAAFPWRLIRAEARKTGVVMDPALTFDWDELMKANSLSNILKLCGSVHIYMEEHPEDESNWLFTRNGRLCQIGGSEDYFSGLMGGVTFDCMRREDGTLHAVMGKPEDPADALGLESWVQESLYPDYLRSMTLEKTEGDLIWAECLLQGGLRLRLAVDRGTLFLRRQEVYYDESLPPSVTCFSYTDPLPDVSFLDSWNQPLRTVTAYWESFPEGVRTVRTELVRLPRDWEYFPYEARWDDYTAYMDYHYTQPYAYPGTGGDYALYLTTAKG